MFLSSHMQTHIKKIIYINRAQGDVMWYEKIMEMHLGKSLWPEYF